MCVLDCNVKVVVLIIYLGWFCWCYFGNVFMCKCLYFDLWSILIDRSCRILVLDVDSNLVYFFNDRGYLLCLIGWGFLEKFVGISLDFEGNLYVVEYYIVKLKVIKYIK